MTNIRKSIKNINRKQRKACTNKTIFDLVDWQINELNVEVWTHKSTRDSPMRIM